MTEAEKRDLRIGYPAGFKFLPVELFKTDHYYYAFDARNVTFLRIDHIAFDVLSVLRERDASPDELVSLLKQHSEQEVRQTIADLFDAQKNGLLTHHHFTRSQTYENSQYEEILSQRMGGFTVFITTQCNLACSYCIFGGQYAQHEEFSQTPMAWLTLQDMMRFLREHSAKSKQVRLDFFGLARSSESLQTRATGHPSGAGVRIRRLHEVQAEVALEELKPRSSGLDALNLLTHLPPDVIQII